MILICCDYPSFVSFRFATMPFLVDLLIRDKSHFVIYLHTHIYIRAFTSIYVYTHNTRTYWIEKKFFFVVTLDAAAACCTVLHIVCRRHSLVAFYSFSILHFRFVVLILNCLHKGFTFYLCLLLRNWQFESITFNLHRAKKKSN